MSKRINNGATDSYPKHIFYKVPRRLDFTQSFRDKWDKVVSGLQIMLSAENILQIEYPSALVKQIRTVNVDDCIYRLDFILVGEDYPVCIFPNVPWNRENFFMKNRFLNVKRQESDDKLILIYPMEDEI